MVTVTVTAPFIRYLPSPDGRPVTAHRGKVIDLDDAQADAFLAAGDVTGDPAGDPVGTDPDDPADNDVTVAAIIDVLTGDRSDGEMSDALEPFRNDDLRAAYIALGENVDDLPARATKADLIDHLLAR